MKLSLASQRSRFSCLLGDWPIDERNHRQGDRIGPSHSETGSTVTIAACQTFAARRGDQLGHGGGIGEVQMLRSLLAKTIGDPSCQVDSSVIGTKPRGTPFGLAPPPRSFRARTGSSPAAAAPRPPALSRTGTSRPGPVAVRRE